VKGIAYLRNVVTLNFDAEKCTGCGTCLSVCPRAVLARSNGRVRIVDRDACIECGACKKNCPEGALTVKSGVGCATAVINQMLGRKGACCVVEDGCDTSSCC
jgi:ferredoxin